MTPLRKRRQLKKLLTSRVFHLVLFLVLAFLLHGLWGVFTKFQIARANYADTADELNVLKEREVQLSRQVEYLQTERGIEGEIRERFNVVKPNEGVIYVVDRDEEREADNGVEVDAERDQTRGLWGRVLNLFWVN